MNWTKDLPAKPGYYWVSLDILPGDHELVEFIPCRGESPMLPEDVEGPQDLCGLYMEEHVPATNKMWVRYWFFGPIEGPPPHP